MALWKRSTIIFQIECTTASVFYVASLIVFMYYLIQIVYLLKCLMKFEYKYGTHYFIRFGMFFNIVKV